jgi:WD40 repeat protein
MILKRVSDHSKNPSSSMATASKSLAARKTGGLCFDFNMKESNVYLVGTEDGQIHKCSSSYNEQYMDTFAAHGAPVNRIRWSPFSPNLFLSCSSDWTVKLWSQESPVEVFKFQSGRVSYFKAGHYFRHCLVATFVDLLCASFSRWALGNMEPSTFCFGSSYKS